jgi:hypothetical protein
VIDVDGDGECQSLTDSLLVMRWMSGFTGDALIAGAIDAVHCTRCSAEDIEAHLDSAVEPLDIDDDTEADELTDGVLGMRWLFGFRGAALIDMAVDTANCERCKANEIEAHLATLDCP